jgi:hypothetical protein
MTGDYWRLLWSRHCAKCPSTPQGTGNYGAFDRLQIWCTEILRNIPRVPQHLSGGTRSQTRAMLWGCGPYRRGQGRSHSLDPYTPLFIPEDSFSLSPQVFKTKSQSELTPSFLSEIIIKEWRNQWEAYGWEFAIWGISHSGGWWTGLLQKIRRNSIKTLFFVTLPRSQCIFPKIFNVIKHG